MDCFNDNDGKFKFETAASSFRVIEDRTVTFIIPFNKEAEDLIGELKHTQYPAMILRNLQPYTISIYQNELDALISKGVVLTISGEYSVLNHSFFEEYYSLDKGLKIVEDNNGTSLFF